MLIDDRTEEQKQTHVIGIAATDKFMSGWGGAANGKSVAIWACGPDVNTDRVENWVRSRKEMQRVRVVNLRTYRPTAAHTHIYVVNPGHPSTTY